MAGGILSPKVVESAKPATSVKRIREKGDAETKGFYLQINPNGAKSWGFSYTSPDDDQRKLKIFASYPATSLSEARAQCRELRKAVNRGVDPFVEKARQAEVEAVLQAIEKRGTVEYCFKIYKADCERRGVKTIEKMERTYKNDINPFIGELQVKDLTISEVKFRVYEPLKKRGSLGQLNKVRTLLRSMVNVGLQAQGDVFEGERVEFGVGHNPIDMLPPGQPDGVGQRFLDWKELKRFWGESGTIIMSLDSSLYFKLAFALGGQRVETLLHGEWSEIDFDKNTFSIPLARRKMSYKSRVTTAHVIPLSELAISLLNELKELTGESCYLFPKPDDSEPRTNDSIRQALDRFCSPTQVQEDKGIKPFTKFNPRDVRRTCKTLMLSVGVDEKDADKLQDHAAESSSSNVNYNRYDYQAEKERAMKIWTSALVAFGEQSANVVLIKETTA